MCVLCVAGNGPSTSRSLFLMNALISLICEMGSTLSSAANLGCPKSIRRGVLYEWYVWQGMVQVHPCGSF